MTKTTHLKPTPCTGIQHSTNRLVIRHPNPDNCPTCNGTGTVLKCTNCGILNCDGCPCTFCFDEKTVTCTDDDCNQGRKIDANDEFTIKCTNCKGKGKHRCPKC